MIFCVTFSEWEYVMGSVILSPAGLSVFKDIYWLADECDSAILLDRGLIC